jgi:hypothetical protein
MSWQLNNNTQMCESTIKFIQNNKIYEEVFPLKIYSISLMQQLVTEAGFADNKFYDNYTLDEGTPFSKNLIACAK